MNALSTKAEKFFADALAYHEQAISLAVKCKVAILQAGRLFRKAKDDTDHGQWELRCKAARISPDTVIRYIEFVSFAEQWARAEKPTLTEAELDDFVNTMILKSPKTYTALLRGWKLVEQEGAYDPTAYRREKVAGPAQLAFHFERADAELRAIIETPAHLEKLERSTLETLRDRTRAALEIIESTLNTVTVEAA